MKLSLKTILAASTITLAMAAGPVSAGVVITFGGVAAPGGGLTTAVAGTKVVTFDNGTGGPDINSVPYFENNVGYAGATGGGGRITSGTSSLTAAPFGDTTNYLTVPSDTQSLSSGSAVGIDLSAIFPSSAANYFGLYWGSLDTYNTITFGHVVGGPNFSFTGSDIAALVPTNPTGDQGAGGSFYVNFFFTGTDSFDTVLLSSTQRAFESDNHAFGQVPEPATLALLGSGLLGFGFLRRRKEV